ncbi:MAG: hypothetical protein ACRDDL_08410 [Sarcina sp.]
MKKYFKLVITQIPGYRSGEKTNKIIASIYYLAFILFFIVSLFFRASISQTLKIFLTGILLPPVLFLLINRASKNF